MSGVSSRSALAAGILAALACVSCGGKVTGPANTYQIPPGLHAAYLHDAGILAWRDLTLYGSVDTDLVEIPGDKVAGYVRLLERVYVADSTRAPFAKLHIHTGVILDSLLLSVQSTAPWLDAFLAGVIPTGESHLDALARKYGIFAGSVYTFLGPSTLVVDVGFPREVNTSALLPAFRQIQGVTYASRDAWASYGNANDIVVLPLRVGEVRIEYSDGNCMTWKFRVTPDSVVFLGSDREPC